MADWSREFPQQPAAPAHAARPIVAFAAPEKHRTELALEHPVTVDGVLVETLTVRRITAGEMVAIVEAGGAPADDADLIRHVTAAMIGWPVEVLDGLSPDDAGRVAAAAVPFLPVALAAALGAMGLPAPPDDPA